MKLAQKGTELAKCPYVTDETRAALDAASAPPIRLITVGTGERAFSVGNETVLFRHEKTFFHQTGIMVRLRDDDPELAQRAKAVNDYAIERVGLTLTLDGVALENASGAAATFADAAATVAARGDAPLALLAETPEALAAAAERVAARKPLLGVATAATVAPMAALAKQHGCPLVVRGAGDLESLADALRGCPGRRGRRPRAGPRRPRCRRHAGPLHPAAPAGRQEEHPDPGLSAAWPSPAVRPWRPRPPRPPAPSPSTPACWSSTTTTRRSSTRCVTLRQNVYTDPQKPIQVEPGLYEIGAVTPDSPLLITTNFSLTYFTVSGEVEGGGTPAYLLVADADGQSVLTSWAAGKFDAEKIAKTVHAVRHRRPPDAPEAGDPGPGRRALRRDRGGARPAGRSSSARARRSRSRPT